MDPRRHPRLIILLACVVEYAPVAVLLSRLNADIGLEITFGCIAAHLFVSRKARLQEKWFRVLGWFVSSIVIDASVMAFGLALHFRLFGPPLFEQPETLRQMARLAVELAATVAAARFCTSSAIKILELRNKPAVAPGPARAGSLDARLLR